MAPAPSSLSKGFTDTIDRASSDVKWDDHDATMRAALGSYTGFLGSTAGYVQPSFSIVKAMLWTESGGPSNPEWSVKPFQIGVLTDPGLAALLDSSGHGDLIMPPAFRASITVSTAKSNAANNIQAGIGYLLLRHAQFAFVNVRDTGPSSPYTVKPHDTLEKIAKQNNTTVQELKDQNPQMPKVLHPAKDVLMIQPAHMEWQITGWMPITTVSAARRYNGGGDKHYAAKLDYCIGVLGKLNRP